jgi:hypothetical protein
MWLNRWRCVVSNTGSWTHLSLGIVKINFDAALNQEKGMVGISVVVRDSMSFLLGAKASFGLRIRPMERNNYSYWIAIPLFGCILFKGIVIPTE